MKFKLRRHPMPDLGSPNGVWGVMVHNPDGSRYEMVFYGKDAKRDAEAYIEAKGRIGSAKGAKK